MNKRFFTMVAPLFLLLALGIFSYARVNAQAPVQNPNLDFWVGIQDSSIQHGVKITGTVAAPLSLVQAEEFQLAWNLEQCGQPPAVDSKGRRIVDILYTVRAGTVTAVTEGTPYQGRHPGQPEKDLLNYLAPNFWQMNQLFAEADLPFVIRLGLLVIEGSNNDPARPGYTAEPFFEFNGRNFNGLCNVWTPGLNFREEDGFYKAIRSSGYFTATYDVVTTAQATIEVVSPLDAALLHEGGHYWMDLVDEYFPDVNLEWLRDQKFPNANLVVSAQSAQEDFSPAEKLAHQEQLGLNLETVRASQVQATVLLSNTHEAVNGLGQNATWFLHDAEQAPCNDLFAQCLKTGGLMDAGRLLTVGGQQQIIGFSQFAKINLLWRSQYPTLWHSGPYIPTELLPQQLMVKFVGANIPAGSKIFVYRSNKNGTQDVLQKIAVADISNGEVLLANPWADLGYNREISVYTQATLYLAVRDQANTLVGYTWLDINDVLAMAFSNADGSVAIDKLNKPAKTAQVNLLLAGPNQPLDQSRFGYRLEEDTSIATFPAEYYAQRRTQTRFAHGLLDNEFQVTVDEATAKLAQLRIFGSIKTPIGQGDLDDLRIQYDRVHPGMVMDTLRTYAVYVPQDQLTFFVTTKGLDAATNQEKLIAFTQYVLSHEKIINRALEASGLQTRISLNKLIFTASNVGGEGLNEGYEFENVSFADSTSQLSFRANDFVSSVTDFSQNFLHVLSEQVLRNIGEPRPPLSTDAFTQDLNNKMGNTIASIGYLAPDVFLAETYYDQPWLNSYHTRLVATRESQAGTNSTIETREASGFTLSQLPDSLDFTLRSPIPPTATYKIILVRFVRDGNGELREFIPLLDGAVLTKEQLVSQISPDANGYYSFGHGLIIQAQFTDSVGRQQTAYRHYNMKEVFAGLKPAQAGGSLIVKGHGILADQWTIQPNEARVVRSAIEYTHSSGVAVASVENKPQPPTPVTLSHAHTTTLRKQAQYGAFIPGEEINYYTAVTTTSSVSLDLELLKLTYQESTIVPASGFWKILSQSATEIALEPVPASEQFVNRNVGSWVINPATYFASMNPGDISSKQLTLISDVTASWLTDEAARLSENAQLAAEYGVPITPRASHAASENLLTTKPLVITSLDGYNTPIVIYTNGSESVTLQVVNSLLTITGSGFTPGRIMVVQLPEIGLIKLVADANGMINYSQQVTRRIFLPLIRK